MLPPIEKTDIPLARRRPLAYAANLEPSGWYAAVPRPERITNTSTAQYDGDAAARAIPMPASATPGAACVVYGDGIRAIAAGVGDRGGIDTDRLRDAAAAAAREEVAGTVAW